MIKYPEHYLDRSDGERSVLINFVLDASGSMAPITDATIAGFNEFKNDQAAEAGRAFMTLTLFDTRFDTVFEAAPIAKVRDLDRRTYRPGGMTALYDAIGHTMAMTDRFVALNRPDQVVFVIMTDGGENSSREYDHAKILASIEEHQRMAEYEFVFLGANQDSYLAGQSIGIRPGRMLDYEATESGSREAVRRASKNVRAHRRVGAKQSDELFTPHIERIGNMSAQEWAVLSLEQRQEFIDRPD
jgi:hypothetical protein